ncbi:DNA mismatch repair protein MutS [Halobacteriales archaeon QS_8_69_26]|nr:MAG: DNA mismatch repair protein MutS [Halobacteriales archaeon QS_8_69_26]
MDDVTGPPPEMAESRRDLTPMMSQYFELCAEYDDALVLFQVGDFYEAFCAAAEEVSRICEITLTQREDSTGTYRMAGVPIDNPASYVEQLLRAGYRVAIADQVEDPDEVTGVVERAVTRVVTPGTVTDDELLEAGSSNYVACVAAGPDAEEWSQGSATDGADLAPGRYAVAFVDVTTGEFRVAGVDRWATVTGELERFVPAEVVVDPLVAGDAESDGPGVDGGEGSTGDGGSDADEGGEADPGEDPDGRVADALAFDPTVTPGAHDPSVFGLDRAGSALAEHVGPPGALVESVAEARACGALLAYAEYTQGGADGELGHVSRLRRYEPDEFVRLDATALRSLEVFESRTHGEGPTLRVVVDETASAPGRRRLTAWLRQPLVDRAAVERRHDAVAALVEAPLVRGEVRDRMAEVYDLERLVTRVTRGRADARDLRSLVASLDAVPAIREALADADAPALADLRDRLDELDDVRDLIGSAIRPEPPAEITEGGVIREGFDEELDELRATEREGKEWVADLEATERERTGIDSLTVGFNDVHGYYIEVTNPNLDRVPDDYTRRQTLKNSERFYTPELKRREDEILGAAERADAREHRLFREVREAVAAEAERIRDLADALADLDALASLAAVAVDRDYVRPEIVPPGEGIRVEAGRHPVVETTERSFVPNDAAFGDDRLAVITGPNMSGKSTYMRQVALICVLAQAGGFVPADRARLPVLDGVFTRVGASDDIAGGQSTFMREMSELTAILHSATERSLVLLDEVGRGTSTVDGLSIAWAVTEYLHDEVGAITLFATHYHELTAIADELDGVARLHFDADRSGDDVTFRYRVREGAASSSYGVEIARMAGIPDPVVERSRRLVAEGGPDPDGVAAETYAGELGSGTGAGGEEGGPAVDPDDGDGGSVGDVDAEDAGRDPEDRTDQGRDPEDPTTGREPGSPGVEDSLAAELRELDVATMTPLEALNRLADLRARAEADAGRPDGGRAEPRSAGEDGE